MTGVIAPPEARPFSAAARPADHASFANFVALALKLDLDAPAVRAIEGVIVSALEPAPVTSVALPALTASEATFCPETGTATATARMAIR
jgi:hypothetical protein